MFAFVFVVLMSTASPPEAVPPPKSASAPKRLPTRVVVWYAEGRRTVARLTPPEHPAPMTATKVTPPHPSRVLGLFEEGPDGKYWIREDGSAVRTFLHRGVLYQEELGQWDRFPPYVPVIRSREGQPTRPSK